MVQNTSSEPLNVGNAASESTGNRNALENALEHVNSDQELTGWKLYTAGVSFVLSNFMMALDTSILAPAIPSITSDFHTIDNIGWYVSSYLLVQLSLQPLFGRLLLYYEPKLFYIASLILFMVGSVLCAVSPTSVIFILGRAMSGCAAAGIVTSSLSIFSKIAPLRERPRGMALVAAFQNIAFLSGPIISGALTASELTWRFNFWINLPVGACCVLAVYFTVKTRPITRVQLTLAERLRKADPIGAVLLVSSLVLLFLALEWGGNVQPFSSPQVWGCLLGFGVLMVSFAIWQVFKKDEAIMPLRLLTQRTIAVCCCFSMLYGVANIIHSSLLSTYFQTVHNVSATMSGVYYIPKAITSLLGITITGLFVSAKGHYVPFLWIGPLIFLAGSVAMQKLQTDSTTVQYLGYFAVTGFGFGLTIHVAIIAVQTVSLPEDVPTACVMELFCSQLGGAIGASIAQSVFVARLKDNLISLVPEEEVVAFSNAGLQGMVAAMQSMDALLKQQFRYALNDAVTHAFIIPIVVLVLAAIVSWFVERRKMDIQGASTSEPPSSAAAGLRVVDIEKGPQEVPSIFKES